MSAKLPAMQFYPGDWRKDPGVQALNYHDRGVWFEILCLMHESSDRGKLMLNGKPMSEAALARVLGLDKNALAKSLENIVGFGVASRDEATGVLFSRRMARDEKTRVARAAAGKLGGSPLLKQKDKQELNRKLNRKLNHIPTTMVNQNPTPSKEDEVEDEIKASSEGSPKKASEEENFDYERGFHEAWSAYPAKGRTKIEDSKQMYVERVCHNPIVMHQKILAPLLPGGKWKISDHWRRGYVFSFYEYLRNSRWLEDPELFRDAAAPQPVPSARPEFELDLPEEVRNRVRQPS